MKKQFIKILTPIQKSNSSYGKYVINCEFTYIYPNGWTRTGTEFIYFWYMSSAKSFQQSNGKLYRYAKEIGL